MRVEEIYLWIIVELVLLVIFLGYLIYRLRKRLRAENLSEPVAGHDGLLDHNNAQVVRRYLKAQVHATRQSGFECDVKQGLREYLGLIRSHFLGAEYEALAHKVGSAQYWEALVRYLGVLLKVLGEKPQDTINSLKEASFQRVCTGTQKVHRNVDLLNETVQRQKITIKQLTKQLGVKESELISANSDPVKAGSNDASDSIAQKLAASERYIKALEKSIATMKAGLTQTQARMNNFHDAERERHAKVKAAAAGAMVQVLGKGTGESTGMDGVIAETEEMNRLNREEVARLHKTISHQRTVIFELEAIVRDLEQSISSSGEGQEKQLSELEKLKRILRETEDCVVILEDEVELLQNRLEDPALNSIDYKSVNESLVEQLHELRSEMAVIAKHDQNNQSVVDYIHDIIDAQSLEDMALVLVEALRSIGVDCFILFSTKLNSVVASSSGHVPEKIRGLLSSHSHNYTGRAEVRKLNDGTLVGTSSISALLVAAPGANTSAESKADADEAINRGLVIVNLASPLVLKVAAQQDLQQRYKRVRAIMDEVKKLSRTVDAQYRYQSQEGQNLIRSMTEEYGNLIKLLKPSKNVLLECENLEREILGRVDLLGENRVVTKNYFERLLKQLENEV